MERYAISALFVFAGAAGLSAQHPHPLKVPPGQTNPLLPEVQSMLRIKKVGATVPIYPPPPAGYVPVDHGIPIDYPSSVPGPRMDDGHAGATPYVPAVAGHPGQVPAFTGHAGHAGHAHHPTASADACGPACNPCETCGRSRKLFARRCESCDQAGGCSEGPGLFAGTHGCLQRFRDWLTYSPNYGACRFGPTPYQPPLYAYFGCEPQQVPPPMPPKERKHLRAGGCDDGSCSGPGLGTRLRNLFSFDLSTPCPCGALVAEGCDTCDSCGRNWSVVPAALRYQAVGHVAPEPIAPPRPAPALHPAHQTGQYQSPAPR